MDPEAECGCWGAGTWKLRCEMGLGTASDKIHGTTQHLELADDAAEEHPREAHHEDTKYLGSWKWINEIFSY